MPDQEVPVESFQTDREYGQVRYGTQLFFNEMPLFLSVRTKSNGQMCVCVIYPFFNDVTGRPENTVKNIRWMRPPSHAQISNFVG